METIGKIRRWHRIDKLSISQIARRLGASRNTVKKSKRLADEAAAKHHQLRVIDESGEDYLYPEEYFVPVQLPQAAEKALLRAANLTSAK